MEQQKFCFKDFRISKSTINIESDVFGEGFNFEIDLDGDIEDKTFTISMLVKIKDTNNVVDVKVVLIGYFDVNCPSDDPELDSFLYLNAPAMIFPYVRTYISTLSNLSGVGTITMPTLDMTEYGNALRAKMEAKKKKTQKKKNKAE